MTSLQKSELRTHFREQRVALPDEIRAEWNQMLWGTVLSALPDVHRARTLLLYFPLPREISLIPLFNYAREHGIRCAFPRCREEAGIMDFHYVEDLGELILGKYGIREPKVDAPLVADFSDALVFVPALAFDRAGHRIGYGGGYYDRFLATHPITSVGVTYEKFMIDSLPHDQYDRAVDIIVTQQKIYRIRG